LYPNEAGESAVKSVIFELFSLVIPVKAREQNHPARSG
jgi:hypothetical protein